MTSKGMSGKHHPKDSADLTALAWASRARREAELPHGVEIKVRFPNGPNGGTWGASSGRFTVKVYGERVGVCETWAKAVDLARERIESYRLRDEVSEGEARGVLEKAALVLETRGKAMLRKASEIRAMMASGPV